MADAIDLHDDNMEDNFQEEEGDQGIEQLKKRVTRKKGRGIQDAQEDRKRDVKYEAMEVDGGANGPARSVEGWILFITNIHEEAKEEDILDAFGEFGELKSIHLNLDRRTGYIKGYCLIEYESLKEATDALEAMNGHDLYGQNLSVDWAFVKGARKQPRSRANRRRR